MITYRIPLRGIKESTNKIYAGIHWTKRKQIKDSILSVAGYFCRPSTPIESYPVEIEYQFVFQTKALDTLNCAFMAKCFEDALRAFGTLKEDDPRFVARSILSVSSIASPKGKKKAFAPGQKSDASNEDYLIIIIRPYPQK